MRRLVPLLLIVWFATGCFVLDEIDKGHAIMDQHASQERREAEAEKKAAADKDEDEGGLFEDLKGQVAAVGGWIEDASEQSPAERDASDTVVSCRIGGRTQFLRKSDCRVRGGRPL